MTSIRAMLACRWSARRIQRYLDADPSAPLGPAEVRRLEAHLATCQRCAGDAADQRALRRALARWSRARMPDQHAVERLRQVAEDLIAQDV